MSYRDELDAAKARIAQLEEEKERLLHSRLPDRKAVWKYCVWTVVAVAAIGTIVYIAAGKEARIAHNTLAGAREEIRGLETRISELRGEAATARSEVDDLRAARETLQGQVAEGREELVGVTANIAAAEAHLRSVTAATEPTPVPMARTSRLTDAQIAARLALCGTGGSPEYPYAEGVVVRREDGLRTGSVTQRFTIRVPNREDVVLAPDDMAMDMATSADGLLVHAFREYRFWSRVEVGDILGITWHVHAGRETVFAVRTTDK